MLGHRRPTAEDGIELARLEFGLSIVATEIVGIAIGTVLRIVQKQWKMTQFHGSDRICSARTLAQ